MSRAEKLIRDLENNPKGFGFEDACKLAELLGFERKGGKGAHRAFGRPGEMVQLNFQNWKGKIPLYQAKQLIAMVEKYRDEAQ